MSASDSRKVRRHGRTVTMPPGFVMVPKETLFFASPGDPEGKFDVVQKWAEAKAMTDLMVTAIARSQVNIASLDLPGARALLEAHALANNLDAFPGESIVHLAVDAIRQTRAMFEDNPNKPDLTKVAADADEAQAAAASPHLALVKG